MLNLRNGLIVKPMDPRAAQTLEALGINQVWKCNGKYMWRRAERFSGENNSR
jgi:hypothetical protein